MEEANYLPSIAVVELLGYTVDIGNVAQNANGGVNLKRD
jgi:hypothetical protein